MKRESMNPVGARAMLRLAERWGGARVSAAALLRRPAVVNAAIDRAGAPGLGATMIGKELRVVDAASLALPPAMLLVLDDQDTVHLVALKDGFLLRARDEVMRWPLRDVSVEIKPGHGSNFRPVEIRYEGATLTVAGAWRAARQRAALQLIERATDTTASFVTGPRLAIDGRRSS
jgi:hypothetical protein